MFRKTRWIVFTDVIFVEMSKTICPRCGAVAVTNGDFRVCPHCGHDSTKNALKMPVLSVRYLPSALAFVAGLAPLVSIFFDVELKYWAIAGFVLVLGIGWVFVTRKFRREAVESATHLNLYTKERNKKTEEFTVAPLRMPETPRTWKPLVSMPRPRQVYLPSGAKFAFSFGILAVCLISVGLLWASSHHRGAFSHRMSWSRGWPLLFNFLGVAIGSLFMIWREATSRKLLRDGEATVGYWNENGYDFWTQSGQRFRHASSLVLPLTRLLTSAWCRSFTFLTTLPKVSLCAAFTRAFVFH